MVFSLITSIFSLRPLFFPSRSRPPKKEGGRLGDGDSMPKQRELREKERAPSPKWGEEKGFEKYSQLK